MVRILLGAHCEKSPAVCRRCVVVPGSGSLASLRELHELRADMKLLLSTRHCKVFKVRELPFTYPWQVREVGRPRRATRSRYRGQPPVFSEVSSSGPNSGYSSARVRGCQRPVVLTRPRLWLPSQRLPYIAATRMPVEVASNRAPRAVKFSSVSFPLRVP